MNFDKLFSNIQFEYIDQVAGSALSDNCTYLVPASPVDDKIAFFAILNGSGSFLESGVGHFNPAYKTERENGIMIYILTL
jgi:hypothetical protein